jgi:hypothetical protein
MMDLRLFQNIIYSVFRGKELSIYPINPNTNKGAAAIDRHSLKGETPIPFQLARLLIDRNIMIEESGNFETRERHFVLDMDVFKEKSIELHSFMSTFGDWSHFEPLVTIYRDNKINKILDGGKKTNI